MAIAVFWVVCVESVFSRSCEKPPTGWSIEDWKPLDLTGVNNQPQHFPFLLFHKAPEGDKSNVKKKNCLEIGW